MQMLIALIGVCAAAMLLWYVYILMKGDDQAYLAILVVLAIPLGAYIKKN